MNALLTFEILARGAASGMVLLLGIAFLTHWKASRVARLGVIFCFSTAVYALVSSETISPALGIFDEILSIVAIFNAVFFWWFVTALFCDDFSWEWWRFAPLGGVAVLSLLHFQSPDGSTLSLIGLTLWQILVGLLMVHAALFGLNGLRDDLVGPRRLFRVAFAVLSGVMGVTVSVVEIIYRNSRFPDEVFLVQGLALAALALLFSSWGLSARRFLVQPEPGPRPLETDTSPPAIEPADTGLALRLDQAMADKLYRLPNLTISQLADRLRAPEHQLRRLINKQLGYRNFSGFLNSYRLADAQEILASPERSRDQVLLIAMDLGYGSIAPFNRAFKSATGLTPTEYRKQALRSAG